MRIHTHSLLVVSSLIALSACTQPAAVVELRGSTGGSSFAGNNTTYGAAPVATVASNDTNHYVGATPVYNASREQDQQAAIAVNDLQPAAGEPKKIVSSAPASTPFGAPTPAPKQEIAPPAEHGAAKPVELKMEKAPANQWTKKERDMQVASDTPAPLSTASKAEKVKFIWPVTSHEVTAGFGAQGKGKVNDGISIAADSGEPVWASADGEVVYADNKMKGYGNMVIVKHVGGKTTTYAHLARYGVEKYDRVSQGDIIGYVGTSGNAKKPQLYFSMRDGTTAVDPKKYLDSKVAGL